MAAASFQGKQVTQLHTQDYGIGWALRPRIAAALGCQAYGSDLAEPRMKYAAALGVKTITDEQIPHLVFDLVNTEQVLEHVPQPLDLIDALANTFPPGGMLKVSVPLGDHVGKIIQSLRNGTHTDEYRGLIPIQPPEHGNCLSCGAVATMGAGAGLNIVRPSLYHGYAFLRQRATIDIRQVKQTLKELVRPIYHYRKSFQHLHVATEAFLSSFNQTVLSKPS